MPLRNVPVALLQRGSTLLSNHLWNIINGHVDSGCKYCTLGSKIQKCSAMTSVKEYISVPPFDALKGVQSNWEKLFKEKKNERDNHFTNFTNSVRDRYVWVLSDRLRRTRLQYLFYSILHVNGLENMNFVMENYEDFYCLKKFGKCVRSMEFEVDILVTIYFLRQYDNLVTIEEPTIWLLIFTRIRNVLCLDLANVTITGKLLGILGKECNQIKVMRNVNLVEGVTPADFLKLCYEDHKSQTKKNNCCRTLETVQITRSQHNSLLFYVNMLNLRTPPTEVHDLGNIALYDIYHILLVNVEKLKFLGDAFFLDQYISQCGGKLFTDVELRVAKINEIDAQALDMLQKYFPKLEKLKMKVNQKVNLWLALSQLRSLETLNLFSSNWQLCSNDSLYNEVIIPKWYFVKHLEIQCNLVRIDLTLFADRFPKLQSLAIQSCLSHSSIKWNGASRFLTLEKVDFMYKIFSEFDWMESFCDTIQSIHLSIENTFDEGIPIGSAGTFSTISFPIVENLKIQYFRYDSNLITVLLDRCPRIQVLGCFSVSPDQKEEAKKYERNLCEQNCTVSLLKYLE